MEGAGNSSRCSPLLRALVLITIALASIQYADADCTTPPTDSNAASNAAGKTLWTPGETATYTCSANFQVVTASGVASTYTRICSSTTWAAASPSGCVAIACRTVPPILANANPSPNTNNQALATVVTYTCTAGNIITGGGTTFTYTCQLKAGSSFEAEWAWTAAQIPANPVCAAPVCPATAPTEPNAAAGTPTGTAGGSTITYTCATNYQVVSGATATQTFTRICTNGVWTAASPAGCTAVKCLTIPPSDSNTPAVPPNTATTIGTTYTYNCNANYVVTLTANTYVRKCQYKSAFEAEWALNPANAKCIAFGCSKPATTMTGAMAGPVTLSSAGGVVTYTCTTGYQVVTGTTATQTFTATCVSTTWTPATAGCTALKCLTAPPTDTNAAAAPTFTTAVALGMTVTYTCNANYVVAVGDPSYIMICKKKTSSMFEAEWALNDGEPADAVCTAASCTTASLPADVNATPGTPTATTVGGTVTYTCKTGFQVVSGATATDTYTRACTTSGWGAATPAVCTTIKCLTVPPTDAGAPAPPASTAPAALNTMYTYTCSANFVVAVGDTTYVRNCQQKAGSTFEGEWALNAGEPSTAACVAYNCASAVAPTARTNAAIGAILLANGGEVTYTCNANFQSVTGSAAAPSFKIICTNNAWPATPNGCTTTVCLAQPPTDSNAPAPSVTLPAAVGIENTYTCNAGYVVAVGDTNYIKICQIKSSATYQGEWVLKASEPTGATCSAFSCPTTAPARDNAVAGTIVTSGGGSITYTCKSGYEYKVGSTITSTFTIKCTNNAWPSSPTGCTGRSLRGWEIALIVIGVSLAVGGIISVSCLCWWYNKNKAADPSDRRQLQLDPRQNQDYAYPPGMGGPPPSGVPPYSRGYPDMAPFQPYTGRSIDASRYNRGKFDNYMYGTKPELPF